MRHYAGMYQTPRRKSLVVSKAFHIVEFIMTLFVKFHLNGCVEEITSFFR